MPYTIEWLVEKKVLLSTLSGVITQPELKRFIEQVEQHLDGTESPVYHISNSLALERVEMSLKSLQLLVGAYPLTGRITSQIDINRHPVNRMLASLATQFVSIETHTFTTQAEAVAFLKDVDPSLANAVWLEASNAAFQTRPLRYVADSASS